MTVPPTATAIPTTTVTIAAPGSLFARTGNIDAESATAEVFAVHAVNRLLRFFGRVHGDEAKPARPAGRPVSDQVGFDDGAVGGEGVLQVVFGDFEVEIPDEQFGAHGLVLPWTGSALTITFPRVGFQILMDRVHLRISISWK